MPRRIVPISILLAVTLLTGCDLLSPAASSVNSSVISEAWLENATSYFENDPVLQAAAGIRPPQVTDPTGQFRTPEISREEIKRNVLQRELQTQLFESVIYSRGYDPKFWMARSYPELEQRLHAMYAGRPLPSGDAIELLNRWNATFDAFITASTGLPEIATNQAVVTIFDRLPELGRRICMSIIAVNSREKADQVSQRLANRESFKAIATELSDHQPSKPRQGDIGCVTLSQAYQLLQDPTIFMAALETPPGSSRGPIQSGTGLIWWVRVADEGSTGFDLESAAPQIVEQYQIARQELARLEYFKALESSDIRIVCPLGRWFAEGPYTYQPLMLSCDEPVPELLPDKAVEVRPGDETSTG